MGYWLRISACLVALTSLIVLSENCSQVNFSPKSSAPLPANLQSGNGDGYTGLNIEGPQLIAYGETATLVASGTNGPYTFTLEQGGGALTQVSPDTAVYDPGAITQPETVIVTVTDGEGNIDTFKFYVGPAGGLAPDFGTDGVQTFTSDPTTWSGIQIPFSVKGQDYLLINDTLNGTMSDVYLYSVAENGQVSPASERIALARDGLGDAGIQYKFSTMASDGRMAVVSRAEYADLGVQRLVLSFIDGESTDKLKSEFTIFGVGTRNTEAHYIDADPEGFIVAGHAGDETGNMSIMMSRLNPDGTVDKGFGDTGNVIIKPGARDLQAQVAIRDGDGYLGVAVERVGEVVQYVAQECGNFAVFRLKRDGTVDATFADQGFRWIDPGCESHYVSFFPAHDDDAIYFSGSFKPQGSQSFSLPFILKIKRNGEIDRSFGKDGWLIVTPSLNPLGDHRSGYLTVVGDRLMLGTYDNSAGGGCSLYCFNKDGTHCGSFGDNGFLHFMFNPEHHHAITGISVGSDGHLLVGGVHRVRLQQQDTDEQFLIKVLMGK